MQWGKLRFRLMLVLLLFVSSALLAQEGVVDLDGHATNPFTASSGKAVVLVFVRRDCPVSGRYAPLIQQISKRYADRVSFWLVYPDKSETSQAIRKSVADFGYEIPVVRDPERSLVKLSRVQITPEVAVFDRSQRLVYDGRIDNWYVDLFHPRPSPTTHELEDTIEAVLSGQRVSRNEVRGVGCYISDLE